MVLRPPFVSLACESSAGEGHPTVQSGGAALAAPAWANAHGVSHSLDGVAEADFFVADEARKAHPVRLGFGGASVLVFIFRHGSSSNELLRAGFGKPPTHSTTEASRSFARGRGPGAWPGAARRRSPWE